MPDSNLFGQGGAVTPTLEAFQNDLAMLAASVNLPIKVAPAPAGVGPDIRLIYSSAAAQSFINEQDLPYQFAQGSVIGCGWMLVAGGVIDTADNLDLAYLTMGGVTTTLVSQANTDGDNGYATFHSQVEDFTKIRKYDKIYENGGWYRYFKLWDKSGTEYRFGREAWQDTVNGTPQYNATGPQQDVYYPDSSNYARPYPKRYYLDRVTDVHGNYMTISYQVDQGSVPSQFYGGGNYDLAVYPSEIDYTYNTHLPTNTSSRRVTFTYGDRTVGNTDVVYVRDAAGAEYYETKNLTSIQAQVQEYSGGTWNWRTERIYNLTYEYWNGAFHDVGPGYDRQQRFMVLKTVTETDGNGIALPSTTFTYEYHNAHVGGGDKFPLLIKADNGWGAHVSWTYTSYAWSANGGPSNASSQYNAIATQSLTDGCSLATATTTYTPSTPGTSNPQVAAWTTKYDTLVQPGNKYLNPAFRGFNTVKVTEPTGQIHEHRFYRGLRAKDGATVLRSDGAVLPDYEEYKGRVYEVQWFESNGYPSSPLGKEWTSPSTNIGDNYTPYANGNDHRDRNVYFVYVIEQRTTRGTGISRRTFACETAYQNGSQYGNPTLIQDYAIGGASYFRRTRRWFWPLHAAEIYTAGGEPVRNFLVAKVAAENVYHTGDVVDRSILNIYDSNTLWSRAPGPRGLRVLTRQLTDLATSTYADTAYAYDTYGHLTSTTRYGVYGDTGDQTHWASNKANNTPRVTQTAYDTQYIFPTTERNALTQTVTKTYYTAGGKYGRLKTLSDLNGQVTTLDYDSHGRPTSVVGPLIGGAYYQQLAISYQAPTVSSGGRTTSQIFRQRRVDNGGTSVWSNQYRFYDGTGSIVQEYRDGIGGSLVTNSHYDGRRLLQTTSVSHPVAGLSGAFAEGDWAANSAPKTSYSYDGLRRSVQVTRPDATVTSTRYAGFDTVSVDQNLHVKRFTADGLGHTVQIVEYTGQDPTTTAYATTAYTYSTFDTLGSVTDAVGHLTSITYDMAGRKIMLIDPDLGTWRYTYNPTGTLQTQLDALGQTTEFGYDVLDRMTRKWYPAAWLVNPIVAGASVVTVYDLIEVRAAIDANRAAAGLSTGIWTDPALVAGRGAAIKAVHWVELRTRIQDLWTLASLGTVPQFTAGGILAGARPIKASDPTDLRGWLNQYETSAWAANNGKRARTFVQYDAWDGATQFGRGKRTALWDGSGYQAAIWDPGGRLSQEQRVIDGYAYTTGYAYDAFDRVRQLTYPDGEILTSSYAANTLLSQMSSSLFGNLLSSVGYNQLDLPTSLTVGNGPTALHTLTYFGIDVSGAPFGGLATQKLQQGSSAYLVNRTLGYDAVGNLTSLVDQVNSETLGFSYDEQDRLTGGSGPAVDTYSYTQIGNINSKNGTTYTYDATHPHAVSNPGTFLYDANGNMTTRGSQAIKYDPENRPLGVLVGSQFVAKFAYDGDGTRRKRLDVNGVIHYAGAYELNNNFNGGAQPTKYYTATLGTVTRLIAFSKGGTLFYVGTDHLGGTIKVSDANFTPLDQMRYFTFGQSRDAGTNLGTDHRFTSQIQDASIGLYWYRSRAYDPAVGRFCAPDSIVPDATNPQALNRYSFNINNPLRYTDPSGHVYDDVSDGGYANSLAAQLAGLVGDLSAGVVADTALPQRYNLYPPGTLRQTASVAIINDMNAPGKNGQWIVRFDGPDIGMSEPHVNTNFKLTGVRDLHPTISPTALDTIGGGTRALEAARRVALPVAVGADAIRLGMALNADGGQFGSNTQHAVGSVAGGWAGAIAGAWAGAEGGAIAGGLIGSIVPVAGTAAGAAIGGVLGGLIGGIAGGFGGSSVGEALVGALWS